MIEYRRAHEGDLRELAEMRWDFRMEVSKRSAIHDRCTFVEACYQFLLQGLVRGNWTYWVAIQDGQIRSCMFVQIIEKVPKPNKLEDRYGYVTNAYTQPKYRNKGIGKQLMRYVMAWAKEQDLEFLLVWPSEKSVRFYEREGFNTKVESMECPLRQYVE